jgi:formiminotetrahydrofolate cyclodeaminase
MEGERVGDLLDRLAARTPTPGGGAAAALAAATAAALVSMVCRVTLHRAPATPALAEVAREADELRRRLLAVMREDGEAFEAVLAARRAGGQRQAEAVQAVTRRATAVPLEAAEASGRLLHLCAAIADSARPSALGELGVGTALAGGALEAAALTARINLKDVDDAAYVAAATATLRRLGDESASLRRRISAVLAARLDSSA